MDRRRFSPGGTHGLTARFIPFMITAIVVAVVMTLPISTYAQGPSEEKLRLEPLTPSPTSGHFVPGEILVKFKPGVGTLSAENAIRAEGLETLEISPYSGVMRVKVAPSNEVQAIASLRARQDVEFVTYNHHIQAAGDPNDSEFSKQWSLDNTGQTGGTPDSDIDAPEAWDIQSGSSDVIIAIIDTGVDLDHPDLQAKIITGYDYVNNDNIPDDDNGHGTHVAGIAAAIGNNGVGIAGVSWGARIMPLKVLDGQGNGDTYDLSQAIYYAVDHGAQVINMSMGEPYSSWPCGWTEVEAAFNYAVDHGVLLAVAAGNQNYSRVNCPAAYDQAIAVGSTTWNDVRSYFSNYGPRLDIVAPGGNGGTTGIYSTVLGGYGYMSGTSMATPHVAGLAALIWSFDPSLTHDQVRTIIQSTADDLGAPGKDDYFGYGRINAWHALESLVSLQISPDQTGFLVDDDSGPFPASKVIEITTTSHNAINWTASVSPSVSWLSVAPPASGTVSAASAANFTLVASRPAAYGTYTTQVIVIGTTPSGGTIGPEIIQVHISYVSDLYEYHFPAIFKNYAP